MIGLKVLAICNTPLQIICAVNMKYSVYSNCRFDIIISDHINNSKKLVDNANKYSVFDNSYYVESFDYSRGRAKTNNALMYKINKCINRDKILFDMIKIDMDYDILLFNNFDAFTQLVFRCLYKRNKLIKAYMIEDGYSSYMAQSYDWKNNVREIKRIQDFIKIHIFGIHNIASHIEGQYLYKPELVKWEAPFERLAIPQFSVENHNIIDKLNKLFGYENMEDKYDKPIIFFEESFRKENKNIGDVELVETIGSIVGRDNIMIKRHPRNDDDIFNKLGYKTNKNTEIPWEVIIINNPDLVNKVLVTICSGAAATPYTMFGMKTKSIILLDMVKDKTKGFYEFYHIYFDYMNNAVFKTNPEVFCKISSIDELKKYFIQWKKSNM